MLHSSGISISAEFVQVEGRVLPAPKVKHLHSPFLTFLIDLASFLGADRAVEIGLFSFSLFIDTFLQLQVGYGQEFFPRNGRWNFNNKVLFFSSIFCFSGVWL